MNVVPLPVGTVCIGHNMSRPELIKFNGMACVIVEPWKQRSVKHRDTGRVTTMWAYAVRWANGYKTLACNEMLEPVPIKPGSAEHAFFKQLNRTRG